MSNTNNTEITKVKIPCRLSYAHIWDPKPSTDGGKAKYQVSLLIDKKDTKTVGLIKAAIEAALELGKEKKGFKTTKGVKTPLRDGDEERDDANYAGKYFINANSQTAPEIVKVIKGTTHAISDRSEVYSGCEAVVVVNFYPFDFEGKKGVAAGLGNICKLRDGQRLSGGSSAAQDFANVDFETEENESNEEFDV